MDLAYIQGMPEEYGFSLPEYDTSQPEDFFLVSRENNKAAYKKLYSCKFCKLPNQSWMQFDGVYRLVDNLTGEIHYCDKYVKGD